MSRPCRRRSPSSGGPLPPDVDAGPRLRPPGSRAHDLGRWHTARRAARHIDSGFERRAKSGCDRGRRSRSGRVSPIEPGWLRGRRDRHCVRRVRMLSPRARSHAGADREFRSPDAPNHGRESRREPIGRDELGEANRLFAVATKKQDHWKPGGRAVLGANLGHVRVVVVGRVHVQSDVSRALRFDPRIRKVLSSSSLQAPHQDAPKSTSSGLCSSAARAVAAFSFDSHRSSVADALSEAAPATAIGVDFGSCHHVTTMNSPTRNRRDDGCRAWPAWRAERCSTYVVPQRHGPPPRQGPPQGSPGRCPHRGCSGRRACAVVPSEARRERTPAPCTQGTPRPPI